MAKTPVYGFPYESQNDAPGTSIRAEAGPLLAEAVETELARVDSSIQTIDDQLDDLKPGTVVALLWRNLTVQSIPSSTETAISFDEAPLDRLGAYNAGQPTRYTPNVAGWYEVAGMVGYAGNTSGSRRARWHFNGAPNDGGFRQNQGGSLPSFTVQMLAPPLPIAFDGVADYLELIAYQSSGAALNTTTGSTCCWMKLTYAGPL